MTALEQLGAFVATHQPDERARADVRLHAADTDRRLDRRLRHGGGPGAAWRSARTPTRWPTAWRSMWRWRG